jgi:hypothetical protein
MRIGGRLFIIIVIIIIISSSGSGGSSSSSSREVLSVALSNKFVRNNILTDVCIMDTGYRFHRLK